MTTTPRQPMVFKRLPAKMLGPLLCERQKSHVYRLGQDEAVKVFKPHVRVSAIHAQARQCALAQTSGLPVPSIRPHGVELPDGRLGLVFQFVEGESMAELLRRHPHRRAHFMRLLAQWHARLHALEAPVGMPAQAQMLGSRLLESSSLSLGQRQQLLGAVEQVREGAALCHGNFTPRKLIIAGDTVHIVGWSNASHGDPLLDVARSWAVLSRPRVGRWPGQLAFMNAWCRRTAGTYLQQYLQEAGLPEDAIKPWQPLQCALRTRDQPGAAQEADIMRWLLTVLPSTAAPQVSAGREAY
jgi:Phosphotransferase enzyme family